MGGSDISIPLKTYTVVIYLTLLYPFIPDLTLLATYCRGYGSYFSCIWCIWKSRWQILQPMHLKIANSQSYINKMKRVTSFASILIYPLSVSKKSPLLKWKGRSYPCMHVQVGKFVGTHQSRAYLWACSSFKESDQKTYSYSTSPLNAVTARHKFCCLESAAKRGLTRDSRNFLTWTSEF